MPEWLKYWRYLPNRYPVTCMVLLLLAVLVALLLIVGGLYAAC